VTATCSDGTTATIDAQSGKDSGWPGGEVTSAAGGSQSWFRRCYQR
jgi:hypothetical protein